MFKKGKRKARAHHSQGARPPAAQQSPDLDSQEAEGKKRRAMEKGFRDNRTKEGG